MKGFESMMIHLVSTFLIITVGFMLITHIVDLQAKEVACEEEGYNEYSSHDWGRKEICENNKKYKEVQFKCKGNIFNRHCKVLEAGE